MELDRSGEPALVQMDFSAAFDRINHVGLVFKLREAGVGGMILKVFQIFLSSRTQRVKVCSSSIDVVSGVPQSSVLGPLLFLLYIADLPGLLQNVLVGYVDDSTLLCTIPHPRDRSSVSASLNDDLAVISDWCSRWGMLANPSKMRGMLISRSRTVESSFHDLVVDGTVFEMVSELKILDVILDFKLAFEKHVRTIAASASKTMSVFRDVAVVAKCIWAFILPVLEYCSPVWMSAATSHLSLFDRVVGQVSRLSGGSVSCDLGSISCEQKPNS